MDSSVRLAVASRQALAAGSKSFNLASRFMGAGQRTDAATLYAFCRMVDDAADDAPSAELAENSLADIEDQLWGRRPATEFMGYFLEVAQRRQVDLRHAQNLIEGVRTDLGSVRIADDRELLRYCYQVASTVGLMMCGVVGVRDEDALPFAVDLGLAMQLTNICRDVREDAGLGRVYLPAARLRRVGLTQDELLGGRVDRAALASVVDDLIQLADAYYASADAGLRYIPFGPRLAITVASRVYRSIGHKLRRRGADAWAGRTVVGRWGKAWVAAGAVASFFGPKISGWATAARHHPELHVYVQDLPGADPGARELPQSPVPEASLSPQLESVYP